MDLTFIGGQNFSGRTRRLRDWVGLSPLIEPVHGRCAYISLDPGEAFSGLTPTVAAELELAAADPAALNDGRAALESLSFGYVLDQNPFTLSGGEQVVAAVIAATVGRPHRLAIDGALEQLAPPTRDALLAYLRTLDGTALVADNRLAEWGPIDAEAPTATGGAPLIRPAAGRSNARPGVEIELVDVSFAYRRGRQVLDHFNLKLEAGTPYLLRGRNGSGKTTLSKLLCGLLRPADGEIRIDGRPVKPWKTPGRFASYHFQNPAYQLFSRTVREELAHAAPEDEACLRFGLGETLESHPLDLPYVLRKRLAIASAATRSPSFLILDEPTLGQDDRAAAGIAKIFADCGGLRISHSQVFDGLNCVSLDCAERRGAAT